MSIHRDKIPFYCPKCGEDTKAFLYYGQIFADPGNRAILQCENCGADWRIEIYEVEHAAAHPAPEGKE